MTPIVPTDSPHDEEDGHVASDSNAVLDRFILATSVCLSGLSSSSLPVDEAVEEMRAHLEDSVHDLQMQGLNPDRSVREALHRFGPVEDVTRAFVDLARTRPGRRRTGGGKRRAVLATLAVAATVAVLGGGAVASAHTSPGVSPPSTIHGSPAAPARGSHHP